MGSFFSLDRKETKDQGLHPFLQKTTKISIAAVYRLCPNLIATTLA